EETPPQPRFDLEGHLAGLGRGGRHRPALRRPPLEAQLRPLTQRGGRPVAHPRALEVGSFEPGDDQHPQQRLAVIRPAGDADPLQLAHAGANASRYSRQASRARSAGAAPASGPASSRSAECSLPASTHSPLSISTDSENSVRSISSTIVARPTSRFLPSSSV